MSLTDQEAAEQEFKDEITSEVQRRLLTETLEKLVELAESWDDTVVQKALEDALQQIREAAPAN